MNDRKYSKDWSSIDADDDNNNYEGFTDFLTKDTARKFKVTADQFTAFGEALLNEIDEKRKKQNEKKEILIKYIIKKSN